MTTQKLTAPVKVNPSYGFLWVRFKKMLSRHLLFRVWHSKGMITQRVWSLKRPHAICAQLLIKCVKIAPVQFMSAKKCWGCPLTVWSIDTQLHTFSLVSKVDSFRKLKGWRFTDPGINALVGIMIKFMLNLNYVSIKQKNQWVKIG